jgi:hypothetical protein
VSIPAGRRSALARLAVAYVRHLARRRIRPAPPGTAAQVLETYRADRLVPLTADERAALPAFSGCVNCGLCALAIRRVAGMRPVDLATAYLRDYSVLPAAAADVEGLSGRASAGQVEEALEAGAAVCPTGVPLSGVAAAVYRLSRS